MKMKNTAKNIFSLVEKNGGTLARLNLTDVDVLSVDVRDGEVEKKSSARKVSFSLTVWVGERSADVFGNDMSLRSLREMVKQACDIARMNEPDPEKRLAPQSMWPVDTEGLVKHLDTVDVKDSPTLVQLIRHALRIDESARLVKGVSCSSSHVSYRKGVMAMFTSHGFELIFPTTDFSAYSECVAEKGEKKSSGWFGDQMVHFSDLIPFEEIGRRAGLMAVFLLGAKPIATGTMPMVLSRTVSESIFGHLKEAIYGENIYKQKSFLKNCLNKQIFPSNITIIDDPFIPRLLSSGVADSECVAMKKITFVENGILKSFATDLKSAEKLWTVSTGHADGFGNFYLQNGNVSPEMLMSDIQRGVYIVEFMGHGPNLVTGDYSRGAKGFLIENGKLARPVQGIIVAGNLREMFMNLSIANDMEIGRYHAPTLRINGMTIAGEEETI